MSTHAMTFATPTDAIRVFVGFPNSTLNETQFFTQLGQTFMPGTPYMLQPLGLAAYLPGVLHNPPPDAPHEFALICYPSRDVWNASMNGTLRGRVYNQTHGGVYAMPPSGAAFPVLVDHLPPLVVDPYFLFPNPVDWQLGTTHVTVGIKKRPDQTGTEFRIGLRSALLEQRERLYRVGIDQVVVTAVDAYAVVWLHGEADELPTEAAFLSELLGSAVTQRNERIICRDEPPVLTITGNSAFNFVFVRESKYFLR